jgi:hypothetical protein
MRTGERLLTRLIGQDIELSGSVNVGEFLG